jgi:hypothetical protein
VVELLPDGARARSASLDDVRPLRARRGRSDDAQSFALIGLCFLTLGATMLSVTQEQWVPLASFGLPLLLGSLLLSLQRFIVLVAVQSVCLTGVLLVIGVTPLRVSVAVVLGVSALIMAAAVTRKRLGPTGESMLIDLRDRLRSQSELPELPAGWTAQAVMRSAGGAQFAGDFIAAAKTQRGAALEVVVVDVSGKGLSAGTRALQLSGAFGGLLGALPPSRFLPAANDYLLRQEWSEGFATAAHLSLSLTTGRFELRTAGHPPGVQLHAGSGKWQVHDSTGPALGLLDDADFVAATGRLQHGDTMMLFTDGLVETPERDYTLGIDKLVGEAERMGRQGFDDGARRLLERLDSTADDRALVLLHRR